MFIEIDVQAGGNCTFDLLRMFDAIGKATPIVGVHAPDPRGEVGDFDVVGWSAAGACQAYAVVVEDSGEGRALLVYGGDDGVRFRRSDSGRWSLDSGDQWGEPCLLLEWDVKTRAS